MSSKIKIYQLFKDVKGNATMRRCRALWIMLNLLLFTRLASAQEINLETAGQAVSRAGWAEHLPIVLGIIIGVIATDLALLAPSLLRQRTRTHETAGD